MEHLLPTYVTKLEFARKKGVSRTSVQHKISAGQIIPVKVGLFAFEMIDWEQYKHIRFNNKSPKKMGHDFYAWKIQRETTDQTEAAPIPQDRFTPTREELFHLQPAAHLRLTASKGSKSVLYELLNAEEFNKGDSGSGDIRIYPAIAKWDHPPNKFLIPRLSPKEKQFWRELEAFPQGFVLLFE